MSSFEAISEQNEEIIEKIRQAEKILVGLGEEFDGTKTLMQFPGYADGCRKLKERGIPWLIPEWNVFCSERSGEDSAVSALKKLHSLLEGRDYFIVSTSTDRRIASFDDSRLVMPCGSGLKKQCAGGCGQMLSEVTEEDKDSMRQDFEELFHGRGAGAFLTGTCPGCGAALVLNNVYVENYDENGYLPQWDTYKKWLQGTLNCRLLVLELGVGIQFPSVIRWPFEKVAFFNQKAFFCRVNEKLYHLAKELSGKGCGISKNAIEWLNQL